MEYHTLIVNDSKSISSMIKEARLTSRLTSRALAKKVECSESRLSQIESGLNRPSLELAFKIENVLGLVKREISYSIILEDYEKAKKVGENVAPPPRIEAKLTEGVTGGITIPVRLDLPKEIILRVELR